MNAFRPLNAVDYKIYNFMRKYNALGALAIFAVGEYADNLPLFFGGCLGFCLSYYLDRYKALYNVKEIHELDLLLQEFLKSYSKLDETFSLKSPLEIMLLYIYLLDNGYLSFQKNTDKYSGRLDYVALNSYQVFAGEFACRHSAPLLSRILNYENIPSGVLITHFSDELNLYSDVAERIKEIKLIVEFLEKEDYADEEFFRINEFVEKLFREGKIDSSDIFLESGTKLGNHAITVSKYDGKNYYLDPTNKCVYYKRMIDGKPMLVNGVIINVPFVSFLSRNFYAKRCESVRQMKRYLKGVGMTFEEELEACEKVDGIWQNNQDILEDFYRENEPIYQEMTEGLRRVRTIMQPKRIFTRSKTEL